MKRTSLLLLALVLLTASLGAFAASADPAPAIVLSPAPGAAEDKVSCGKWVAHTTETVTMTFEFFSDGSMTMTYDTALRTDGGIVSAGVYELVDGGIHMYVLEELGIIREALASISADGRIITWEDTEFVYEEAQ